MENYSAYKNISDMFNRANMKSETPKVKNTYAPRKAKSPVRLGSTCPNCFEKKSITGSCFCNL